MAVVQVATGAEVAEIFREHYGMKATYAPVATYLASLSSSRSCLFALGGAWGGGAKAAEDAPYSAHATLGQAAKETREAHPQCMDLAQWLRTNPLPAVDAAVEACIWGIF